MPLLRKYHKLCLLLPILSLLTLKDLQAQVPTITSFSPTSGVVGSSVTLTGTNFNTTPTNNIVFFGATRATVTADTAEIGTVTVPTGATYAPITLLKTENSLAASSRHKFTPICSPAKNDLTMTDFQTKQDFATGTRPASVAMGDLDWDGNSDLAAAKGSSATVSLVCTPSPILSSTLSKNHLNFQ